jgi:hypothetical protein
MVDHFEPRARRAPLEVEKSRMRDLLRRYPALADRHKDSSGVPPKRTWFFPPHDHRHGNLKDLVSLCERGYGEIELHLHHGKTRPDTAENLEETIRLCIREYSRFGVFGTADGEKRYGFIHGDWALDNSRRDGRYCGVNDELEVLLKTGCYADFTFPSCDECNPAKINAIYYAKEDGRPKSYNAGIDVRSRRTPPEGLMLIQGPLHPIFLQGKCFGLRAFSDEVALGKPASPQRIDLWIRTAIHVSGRSDWVFVKCHTHGAIDADVVLGDDMDETFRYLETAYNDGAQYVLHYVTARELYNLVKAAEAGPSASPCEYRDYRIRPPEYDSSPNIEDASDRLLDLVSRTYED